MIQLDLQTLGVVLTALCITIGAPLVSISGPRRGRGALWYWGLSLLTLASGSILLMLREVIPQLVSIVFGNALIICAVALLGSVASSLTKQSLDGTNRWFFAAVTGPILGLMSLTVDPIWPRVAYMAVVECYLIGQLVWQLRRSLLSEGKPRDMSVFAFEVLLWVFLAETIVRIVSTFALAPREAFFFQRHSVAVAILLAILLVAVGTCVLIWHELKIKDDASRFARTKEMASGLLNQAIFMQLLEGRLATMVANGDGSIALLRVRLSVRVGTHVDPLEYATVFRNAGARIDKFLDRTDVLARVSDDEFGVLFRGSNLVRAVQALRHAMTDLQSRPITGDRVRYLMNGTATLISCVSPTGSAAEVVKILRDGLDDVMMGDVRILDTPRPKNTKGAAGTSGL